MKQSVHVMIFPRVLCVCARMMFACFQFYERFHAYCFERRVKGVLSSPVSHERSFLLQRPQDEDSNSAICEFLPALERRDGLSGSNSLYHVNLSDPFGPTSLRSNNSTELPSQSCPSDRTVGSRTTNGKRTVNGSPPSSLLSKKARRSTSDRPPLVQHNAEKKQDSNNVSPILQQHNKTTVCVY